MRAAGKVRRVRDVRDNAVLRLLAHSLFGKTEEPYVQVVEELLPDSPPGIEKALAILDHHDLAVYLLLAPPDALVVIDQVRLFLERHSREPIVWRVTEDDDDLGVALNLPRCLVFLSQLREVHLDLVRAFPPRERIGEKNGRPLTWQRLRAHL